jgi:lysosomal acid lipase/cholesteryl ester hydrolase
LDCIYKFKDIYLGYPQNWARPLGPPPLTLSQLGNNRGNKYSKKSIKHSPTSPEFWNFSIDEFAFFDIPDSISYVLETTGQRSLSYIGFSQGTAQAFATLAIHPKLNQQVNVFIALAPAMSPAGLSNGVVDALVKASPSVLFLLFGRRSILSSATMWQSVMYPPIFVKIIDVGMSFLFGWRTRNISMAQKFAAYPHLYSFTSTKSVVHWFQIIRNKSFQMYDDDLQAPLSLGLGNRSTKVARYPTRNIKTPIVLVYGGSDSLVDIRVMLRELPPQTIATEVPHYEHLDFLWARDVNELVFKHVFDALDGFTDARHTKEEYARYNMFRQESLQESALRRTRSQSLRKSQQQQQQQLALLARAVRPSRSLVQLEPRPDAENEHAASRQSTTTDAAAATSQPCDASEGAPTLNGDDAQKPMPSPPLSRTPSFHARDDSSSSAAPPKTPRTPHAGGAPARGHHHRSHASMDNNDDGDDAVTAPSTPDVSVAAAAAAATSSSSPVRSMRSVNLRRGGKGITLAASKAAGGIVTTSGAEAAALSPGEVKSPWSVRGQ